MLLTLGKIANIIYQFFLHNVVFFQLTLFTAKLLRIQNFWMAILILMLRITIFLHIYALNSKLFSNFVKLTLPWNLVGRSMYMISIYLKLKWCSLNKMVNNNYEIKYRIKLLRVPMYNVQIKLSFTCFAILKEAMRIKYKERKTKTLLINNCCALDLNVATLLDELVTLLPTLFLLSANSIVEMRNVIIMHNVINSQ